MKSVKKIKEFRKVFDNDGCPIGDAFDVLFDQVIAITERIEAQVASSISDDERKAIERAAMIKALEWSLDHAVTVYSDCVRNEIARLKEGGDL